MHYAIDFCVSEYLCITCFCLIKRLSLGNTAMRLVSHPTDVFPPTSRRQIAYASPLRMREDLLSKHFALRPQKQQQQQNLLKGKGSIGEIKYERMRVFVISYKN